MIIKEYAVHGWEEVAQAIGLSYGKPLDKKRAMNWRDFCEQVARMPHMDLLL